jgi:lysophospholipase L1-like esterase
MKKNIKSISLILLTISAFFFFYTFYESEIKYEGKEHSYYIKYYLICSILIACSVVSFFLKKETIINILVLFFASLFALYLINSYLIFKKKRINYDNRTKFQFYQDLKKFENNIAVSMYPQSHGGDDNYPLYSLSSISSKKTIHCNESGYFSIHHTDRYGFNNPDFEWEKNKIEFLLVGDSFTHGACVNETDTISGNLRKMIDNGGVLNLGYSGNGPLTEYATLREYLPLKKINRVLWIYAERNDLSDLMRELEDKTLLNYLNDRTFTQRLHLRQNEIDKKLEKIFDTFVKEELKRKNREKIISFIRLYNLRNFIKIRLIKPTLNMKIPNKILKEFSEIIYLSKILSDNNEIKLYFVYLPDYFKYYNKSYQNTEFKKYKDVITIINRLNIPIIDINKDLMEEYPDPLALFPFRTFNHYNELGYKLISKTILKKIIEYEKN